ncbi:protein HEG homolog 1 isoform X2 [Lissotriton helveticus]
MRAAPATVSPWPREDLQSPAAHADAPVPFPGLSLCSCFTSSWPLGESIVFLCHAPGLSSLLSTMLPCTAGQPPALLMLLFLLPPSGSTSTGPSLDRPEPATQRLNKRREAPLYPVPPPSYSPTNPGASGPGGSPTRSLVGASQTSHPSLGNARAESETAGASWRAGERMMHSPGVAETLPRRAGGKIEGPTSAASVTAWNPAQGSGHHLSHIVDLSTQESMQASFTPGTRKAHPQVSPDARRQEVQSHILSEPGRQEAQTHTASQPGRREAYTLIPLEAQTPISSQSVKLDAQTHMQSGPGRVEAQTHTPSQPGRRAQTHIPSPPRGRNAHIHMPSAPEMAEAHTYIPYESGRQETYTHIALGRQKEQASIPSEVTRAYIQSHIPSELERAVPETRALSEPMSGETRILPGSEMKKVLVSSESRRSEDLTSSLPWRPEAGQTEIHIPSELATAEPQTLPEPGRDGGGSRGRLIHARSPRNKVAGYHTFQEQDASAVHTQGTETPPEPGRTRSATEWKVVRALNQSERMMVVTRTSVAIRSSLGLDVLGQVTARPAETFSEEPRGPDLSEPPDTRGEASSGPGMMTLETLPEPRGARTRTPQQLDGTNKGTNSRALEAKPRSPPEPGGAASQTSSSAESGQTAAEADRRSAQTSAQASRGPRPSWMRDPFPSEPDPDRTESHVSSKAWTSPLGALDRDWGGGMERKQVDPVSMSEPGTGNDQEPASSTDAEKSASLSHTDSMYISTTYNRGGERTLLSITNRSMSADITESSVSYNTSKTSDFPDSPSVQDNGRSSSLKGDTHFAIGSWELFLDQSSKTSTHSSQTYDSRSETLEPIDSFQNTTKDEANTDDPSVDSGTTTSRSDDGSTVQLPSSSDLFVSSVNGSLPRTSHSSLSPESFSSTLSESFSSLHSETSSPFTMSESSTETLTASSSTSQSPFFPSPSSRTSSIPVTFLEPVVPKSPSPIPSSFSEVPSSISTTSLLLSWRSPRPSPTFLFSAPTPSSWSPSLFSSLPSASLSTESYQTSFSSVARQDPGDTAGVDTTTGPDQSSLSTGSPQTGADTSMGSPMLSSSEITTERFNSSLSKTDGISRTESFMDASITWEDGTFGKTTAFLATKISSTQGAHHFQTPKQATSIMPDLTTLSDQFTTSQRTAKNTVQTVSRTTESLSAELTTHFSVLFRTSAMETDHTSRTNEIPGMSTTEMGVSSSASISITEQNILASVPPKTFSSVKTTAMPSVATQFSTFAPPVTSQKSVGICSPNPCLNGGKCVMDQVTSAYKCQCLPSWTGEQCATDVDECLSNPCPSKATCINTQGSFTCRCSLGYQLEKGTGCSLVRTFIGQIKISSSFINSSDGKHLDSHDIEGEIIQMFNKSLSLLDGYNRSSILDSREPNNIILSVQHIFSTDSNVTIYDVMRSLQSYIKSCEASDKTAKHCRLLRHHQIFYKAGSLCNLKYPECDKETSECTDLDGIAICQCRTGYFKYSKMDFSCRACEDGYKRENGTCIRCPFGLGGFNCGNPYQLITIVIAAAGGGLLLILGTALIITCCSLG